MKEDLQCLSLRIFRTCLLNCITLEVEWIPRSANDRVDFLSRIFMDYDDGGSRGTISFWPRRSRVLTLCTGLQIMKYSLAPFQQQVLVPWYRGGRCLFCFFCGREINWLVPPIFLIPRVLNHMVALGGRATLVVPSWPSAPFWPLIFTDEGLSPIFSDFCFFEIHMVTDVFVLGNYKNALFGSPNFHSGVLFLRQNRPYVYPFSPF